MTTTTTGLISVGMDTFLLIVVVFSSTTWKDRFPNRNLIAYSASPLLVYPTHFTGQEGYISDTEGSTIHDIPATLKDLDDDELRMLEFAYRVNSLIGLEEDPLKVNKRFYEPTTANESWYKTWNYKLYKTEL